MEIYLHSIQLLLLLIAMVVVQALVASVAHRKQAVYIPGIVDNQLDHHSFVFRSHRTFMNSLENVPLFILTAMLAMWVNVSATQLFWTVLVFVVARFIHMLLFYRIATNANPSPRSYFYLLALASQIYLLVLAIISSFAF